MSIVSLDRSFDILSLCSHPSNGSDVVLPSWCLDWSTTSMVPRQPLIDEQRSAGIERRNNWFEASKYLIARSHSGVIKDSETGTESSSLVVEGLCIDEVETVANWKIGGQSPDEMFEHLLGDLR